MVQIVCVETQSLVTYGFSCFSVFLTGDDEFDDVCVHQWLESSQRLREQQVLNEKHKIHHLDHHHLQLHSDYVLDPTLLSYCFQ